MNKTQIGWYNLKEDKGFHYADYECAAWYENVEVKAGKYPVFVYDYRVLDKDGEIGGHVNSAYVSMPGTIVSDYFGTLFCGNPISDYDEKKNAGKSSEYKTSSYLFMIADSILNKPDCPWELLPEYEAREIKFEYDGKPFTSHGIFVKEKANEKT